MNPVHIHGVGLWTPGYDRPLAWCQQKPDPSIEAPDAKLLEGPLRRRATPLTRMAVDVFTQVTSHANRDPSTMPTVWATAHGEHTPAMKLLQMMQRTEGKISPTQFHNSVHNTASGYASIATGNVAPSTTLTGGTELVAAALLEAWCLCESSGRDVALVLADEPLQPPFERDDTRTPLAIALLLSQDPQQSQRSQESQDPQESQRFQQSKRALGVLTALRRETIAAVPDHERFGHLHVAAALPLLEQIVRGQPGRIALQLASDDSALVWCVDLQLAGASEGASRT